MFRFFLSPPALSPRASRLAAWIALLTCIAFAIRVVPGMVARAGGDFLAYNDFFAQWSFALFARTGGGAAIYDAETLHRFQLAIEPELRQTFPFPYPPPYLFAVWPLGWFRFGVAQAVWDAASLGLFLWAVLGPRVRAPMLAFAALAPVTVIALIYGQSGLLESALLVGGTRIMGARPIAGGILLGLATIKPQLGVLVPVALIAAGSWRTLAATTTTAVGLVLASAWAFGAAMWPAWWHAAQAHAAYVEQVVNNYQKPSLMAALALLGVGPAAAHAIQAAVAIAVAAVVFGCFRRAADGLSIAALQVGTFLAMPFVFRYDMAMLANAILLVWREIGGSGRRARPVEAGILFVGLLFPALTYLTTRFFYVNAIALFLLFGLIVRLRFAARDGAGPAQGDRLYAEGAELRERTMSEEVATLGGGCFWCLEAVFKELRGVSGVVSGYAGGHDPRPTYHAVCGGGTGHAEVVQVKFDPAQLDYADLLRVFYAIHDPTTLNRQGNDAGTQYRSIVLTHSDAQKATAEAVTREIGEAGIWGRPIVTKIEPLAVFYEAEPEHHDYFARNPWSGYCQVVVAPKVVKFRKHFADRLKRAAAE